LRQEKDSLGFREIPDDAFWGAQTSRAVENYPISGERAHPETIKAYARIKKACAETNREMGRLDPQKAEAIATACDEVLAGKWQDQFVVDVYQAGAGTSFHMNVNEVLAGRAAEILGKRNDRSAVNPNDDVNLGQSTNDTFPTALHLAALAVGRTLSAEVGRLADSFAAKGREFEGIVKSGRTHLMDAVPVTLGQEFRAYASALTHRREAIDRALEGLTALALGGTAAGTGLNTPAGFRELAIAKLAKMTGEPLKPASDPREALQSRAEAGDYSAALRAFAVELNRIANDLRLLASGPATGLEEIRLPAVQPGSSIMPGKVNPVLAEALNMVCFQVIGYDLTIAMATQAGQLELNVMMPVIAHSLFQSLTILAGGTAAFTTRCVAGIQVDAERCRRYAEDTVALATALSPRIGYERAATVAKASWATGRTIREVVVANGLLTAEEASEVLDPRRLTEPR